MPDSVQLINDILAKNHEHMGYSYVFPQYNILPDEVKLALSVLKKHGMQIHFEIHPDEKQPSPEA